MKKLGHVSQWDILSKFNFEDEIREIGWYETGFVIFGIMLDYDQKGKRSIFYRKKTIKFNFFLSSSCLGWPKRTIMNNSDIKTLSTQTLKHVEKRSREFIESDMSYGEFKDLCREFEKYNHLYIGKYEIRSERQYCICHENRPIMFIKCIPETIFSKTLCDKISI